MTPAGVPSGPFTTRCCPSQPVFRVADPETGAANKELLAATSAEALEAALAAMAPVAARVDELVGAGAAESLESTATAVRDAVATLTA